MTRPAPMTGVHDETYWRYAKDGELRVQRCGNCGAYRYPPGPVCPECLAPEHEWARLSGTGRLVAWTVFHRQYFPELPVPYVVVVVRSAEGPFLIGNLVGAGPGELRHDQPLRAVFEDTTEGWRLCQWTTDQEERA